MAKGRARNPEIFYNNGAFTDADGNAINPITKTLTQFLALGVGAVADGAVVRITDVHGPSGYGGVYTTYDSAGTKWGQNFGTPWVFTTKAAAEASFPAASYPGWKIRDSTYGLDYVSDGTEYVFPTGSTLLTRSEVSTNVLIVPAATFTAVTAGTAAAGADTTLGSAGAHGLSTAVAVTAGASYIYISGGTGWTVGWHKINSITDANNFVIDTPYDAGFGAPTIVLAGSATLVPMLAITIPPLTLNGEIALDMTPLVSNSNNAKNLKIKLNSTEFFAPTFANVTGMSTTVGCNFVIANQNNLSSQKATVGPLSYNGIVSTSADGNTGSVATSSATTLNVYYNPSTANERCSISRYRVTLRS